MSSLVALVGPPAEQGDAEVRALLTRPFRADSATVAMVRVADDAVLGVAAPDWDEGAARRLATDGRYTVVAHAAIYYRATLNRALVAAGHAPCPVDASGADAILAAVQAWRWECVQHLEGEFSCIVWDAHEHSLFAARDHAGGRTLYFTRIGDGLAVSSSLRTVAAVPGCTPGWNLTALAEDAADIDLTCGSETAFSAVDRIPGGHALTWHPGAPPRVARWWEIPIFEQDSGVPFDEAAEELRRLIADAVAERCDLARGSAVMLSGGYDSTAIFAAGSWRLAGTSGPSALRTVSFSHPIDDPGREDELVAVTTERWGRTPFFIPESGVPANEPSLERARMRDEPFYHTYELWNRELARGCRAQDARIGLNGNGGDYWFSTSPIFLADLFRQGHWGEFRREWRSLWGPLSWYRVFKVAVQPNLSPRLLSLLALLRGGRPIAEAYARKVPPWLSDTLQQSEHFLARRRVPRDRRPGEGHSSVERTWFLRTVFTERVNALVFSICQGEGVELRTPLLDSRIVRFAATRPRWESNSGRENKRLLRASMRGLLPDEVVGPRTRRTGVPSTYLDRTLDASLQEAREQFAGGMVLAELGVVDHGKLLADIDSFISGHMNDRERAAAILAAAQSEWWLRTYHG